MVYVVKICELLLGPNVAVVVFIIFRFYSPFWRKIFAEISLSTILLSVSRSPAEVSRFANYSDGFTEAPVLCAYGTVKGCGQSTKDTKKHIRFSAR